MRMERGIGKVARRRGSGLGNDGRAGDRYSFGDKRRKWLDSMVSETLLSRTPTIGILARGRKTTFNSARDLRVHQYLVYACHQRKRGSVQTHRTWWALHMTELKKTTNWLRVFTGIRISFPSDSNIRIHFPCRVTTGTSWRKPENLIW